MTGILDISKDIPKLEDTLFIKELQKDKKKGQYDLLKDVTRNSMKKSRNRFFQ